MLTSFKGGIYERTGIFQNLLACHRDFEYLEVYRSLLKDTIMEKGRWVRVKGTHTGNYVTYECSVCGKTALWVRGMKSLYPSDNCPHCGADMVSKRTAIAE